MSIIQMSLLSWWRTFVTFIYDRRVITLVGIEAIPGIVVNHLISLGANRDDAFISAARFGKRDIMDYFLPLVTMGVLDSALDTAIRHSNHEIVEYLKSLGAKEGV